MFCFPRQIYQRLSEEATNGVEETQDRCITFLRKFRTYLSKIYSANADDIDKVSYISCRSKQSEPPNISVVMHFFTKRVLQLCNHLFTIVSQLPVSMEEVVDLLNDVNQQLGESGEAMDEEEEKEGEVRLGPTHSSPAHPTDTSANISHIKFSTPSPNKSISPSKRHLVGSGYLPFEIL